MVRTGTGPTRISKKDYDFHKSFGTIGAVPVFPVEYFTDAGLWVPDQNTGDTMYNLPPLPYGCTDYTQADLANDESGALSHDPMMLENITNANRNGGADIRKSLLAAVKVGWFTGFFNIQPRQLDFFDSIRYAMISGIPEKRSVSIGTPWCPEFEGVGLGNGKLTPSGIISMPESLSTVGVPWHNWKICGWKVIGDQTYLIGKSWQGVKYGDKGYAYFSRPLVNSLMSVPGAVAFTATKGVLPPISTISPALWSWLVSNIKSFLGLTY